MKYKRIIPCVFLDEGKAVKWFDDRTVIHDDAVGLAKFYYENGADALLVFDLSDSDQDHDEHINLMKKINRVIRVPMVAGGNVKRMEDIKKILYTGAKRAILNFSKESNQKLLEEAASRFGKEKIMVSLNDFDTLFKQQKRIAENCDQILFMHRLDLNSVMNITDIPCTILTDTMEESEILRLLKCSGVKGVAGKYLSQLDTLRAAKEEGSGVG